MSDVTSQLDKAKSLLATNDYGKALELYESLIKNYEKDVDDPSPYFGAAYIYEHQWPAEGEKLAKALNYYMKIISYDSASCGAISLAIARVLFKIGDPTLAEEAIERCEDSLAIRESAQAHMLLGSIQEYWLDESELARNHFIRAYRLGMPWGLRFYARSLIRSRKYVIGTLAHLRASVSGLGSFLRRGDQSVFG